MHIRNPLVYYEALDTKNDPALGHILTYTEGVDATCETAGTKAYWTCSRQCDNGSNCGLHFAAAGNHEDAANQAADAESLRLEGTSSSRYVADIDAYRVIAAKNHGYGTPAYAWATDGKTVTVTFTCANDDSHKIVINGSTETTDSTKTETSVPVTASTTENATCTERGKTTYSISGTYPAKTYSTELYYSNSKVVDDIASTGHAYSLKNEQNQEDFVWKKNETTGDMTAKATFICANNSSHTATHEVSVTSKVTQAPTCTAEGERTFTGKVTFLGNEYTKQKTEKIDELGHAYGQPVFTWSDDGKTATATFTCIHDTSHKQTLNATVTSDVETPAGCLTDGVTAYYATVTFLGKHYSDIQIVRDLTANGHSLIHVEAVDPTCVTKGNIEYWYCESCNKYFAQSGEKTVVEINDTNKDGVVTKADTILAETGHKLSYQKFVAPVCEKNGYRESWYCVRCEKYFADTNAERLLTDENGESVSNNEIPETGHSYDYTAPVYIWEEDGKAATVICTCGNDENHEDSHDCEITSVVKIPATCTQEGVTTYTAKASVSENGIEYVFTDTKNVTDIPALGHREVLDAAVPATCTKDGKTEGSHCGVCQAVLKPQAVVEKTGHSFTEYIPDGNATQGQDGTKTAICDHGCGAADTIIDVGSAIALQNQLAAKARQESVAEIKEKLGVDEKTAQTIEEIKQKFKIKQEIITLTDEAVQNSTNIKGDAFGMLQARTTKLKKKSITVKWTKVKGADGYIVYGCRCKRNATYKKLKEFKGNKNFSYTNKKLASGTYYKYIVVAYKNVDGASVTLGVSKSVHATTTGGKNGVAESIKIKKAGSRKNARSVTLKVGKTAQITAVEVEEDKPIKHHRGISYESSNSDVATVTSKGLIRANGTGKCKIYVYAQNGVYKTVNVTVK